MPYADIEAVAYCLEEQSSSMPFKVTKFSKLSLQQLGILSTFFYYELNSEVKYIGFLIVSFKAFSKVVSSGLFLLIY